MNIPRMNPEYNCVYRWFLFPGIIIACWLCWSCRQETGDALQNMALDENWKFRNAEESVWRVASVPGCIHTDLINNGLIEDPFYRVNEKDLQWISEKDWEYKTRFELPPGWLQRENIELRFDGLDTHADVYLNDELILRAENMFRTWRVDCKPYLKPGANSLRVYFHSVFKINLPKWENAPFRLLAWPNNDQADVQVNMYSRKAGFHFGWDWGPRLITAGIWRPVTLQAWDDFVIRELFIRPDSVSAERARLTAVVELEASKELAARLRIQTEKTELADREVYLSTGKNVIEIPVEIGNPRLWWSNGLGEQPLYSFSAELTAGQHHEVKTVETGLRDLKIIRRKDKDGESFHIQLNGVPVFMKGANYIPQDNFQNRVSPQDYEHLIRSVSGANMNMLRVWGGGIYEEDRFYELCDRYGILIWQDFMFACAMYPADDDFLYNVSAEISDNVRRLRNHPSIALYCGNNENEISWHQWEWKACYSDAVQQEYEKDMRALFYGTIPAALNEVDPTRYYHPTSPNTGYNDIGPGEGDVHYWGVWHGREPFTEYNRSIGRFMSEYGFQSFPGMATIEKFAGPQDLYLDSEVMLAHQRCMADNRRDRQYGNRLIKEYMARDYRIPQEFGDFVYISQLLQAGGVKQAIEAHRRAMPYCMGSLYWQINDCWPVASWSSIDYYGNWKALHYRVRDAYRTFLISAVENDGALDFFLVSDSLNPIAGDLTIRTMTFDGKLVFQKQLVLDIAPRASQKYHTEQIDDLIGNQTKEGVFLRLTLCAADGKLLSDNNYYFVPLKDLNLPVPEIRVKADRIDCGYRIVLKTTCLAKDVFLRVRDFAGSASFSNNYFDLLPGAEAFLIFSCDTEIPDFEKRLEIKTLRDTYE